MTARDWGQARPSEKAGGRLGVHRCPVPGCAACVLPSMLMCRGHWWALPGRLRVAVRRAHQSGDRREWVKAAMEAVKFCAPLYRLREVREARLQ
ncbi:MAG: hypothetical protein Q8O40_08360 [Chloroflexota bacterium]|nr:hypothetical protein [Chloroflexota bacterium]